MIAMSFHYLQNDNTGILPSKEVAKQTWYLFIFRTHIFFGLIAICIAPAQFPRRLRNRYPVLHKRLGYIYVASIALSGISGLIIAQFAMGGMISTLGFSLLSIIWLIVTSKAVAAAISRDLLAHQRWMTFSFALTFAAITQRTLLLIPLLTDVPFMPIYQLSAWLPWIVNLIIAHLINQSVSETTGRRFT